MRHLPVPVQRYTPRSNTSVLFIKSPRVPSSIFHFFARSRSWLNSRTSLLYATATALLLADPAHPVFPSYVGNSWLTGWPYRHVATKYACASDVTVRCRKIVTARTRTKDKSFPYYQHFAQQQQQQYTTVKGDCCGCQDQKTLSWGTRVNPSSSGVPTLPYV